MMRSLTVNFINGGVLVRLARDPGFAVFLIMFTWKSPHSPSVALEMSEIDSTTSSINQAANQLLCQPEEL